MTGPLRDWHPRMGGEHPARDAVAATIRGRIADGTYPPGSLLPALHVLAEEHGCSQTPVSQARRLLHEEGLVEIEHARGCRVRAAEARPALREGLLLDALRWTWAPVYRISLGADGRLKASRTDGTGSVTAGRVEALRDAIRADYLKYAAGVAL